MKKFVLPLLFFVCIQNLSFGIVVMPASKSVVCTDDMKTCLVGGKRISDGAGLVLYKGFVCTHNGNMCTNGYYNSYGGFQNLDLVDKFLL